MMRSLPPAIWPAMSWATGIWFSCFLELLLWLVSIISRCARPAFASSTDAASTLAAPSRALAIDPAAPAPTLGGNHLTVSSGMVDQTPLLERADVVELQGGALAAAALMLGTAEAELTVLEAGTGDIVVKLVDRRPDGEVRLLREAVVALAGAGSVRVSFSSLAYRFDAGSAPGLVVAGMSLPGYRSDLPPLSGTVRLGGATLQLPVAAE